MRWLALACALLSPSLAMAETWGVGLRATTLARGEEGAGDPLTFRGGGVQLRFRPWQHWSFELSLDALHAESEGGSVSATMIPFIVAARFHLFTRPQWDAYLLFGVGSGDIEVKFRVADGTTRTEEIAETQVHLGAGLEYRLGRFGLGGELRAVGSSTREAAPTFRGPPTDDDAGLQLHFTATFYF